MGLEDAVCDLAAMSMHVQYNRQSWFQLRISELICEAEIAEKGRGDAQ